MAKIKKPTDTNVRAKSIVHITTGETSDSIIQEDAMKAAAARSGTN